jgi:sugar lactone lactonase YvrE
MPATPTGSGPSAPTHASSAALQQEWMYPDAIAVDRSGNLYVVDDWGMRIDRISPAGQVTTVAKTTYGDWKENVPAMELPIGHPTGIAVAEDGTLYLATAVSGRVVRLDASGKATSAASGEALRLGAADVALDRNGDLLILENGGLKVFRSSAGKLTTIVSADTPVRQGGTAQPAVKSLSHLALDPQGRLVMTEGGQHRLLRLETDGHLEVIAGTGQPGFSGDGGPAGQALLNRPDSLAVDATGNVFVADTENRRIRRISPDGIITTVAGTDTSPAVYPDNGDNGPATSARLINLQGLAVDAAGNVLFSDSYLKQVRRIDKQGVITRVAGRMPTVVSQPPYGTETLSLSEGERRVARALADAVRAFDDRIAENGTWWAKLQTSQDLETLLEKSAGIGLFEQSRSSAAEPDGSTTKTLTTRQADKVVETVETLSRTDAPGTGLQRAKLNRVTNVRGPSSSRESTIEDQTIQSGRFGLYGPMTIRHTDAQGDADWQLTATTGPGPTDGPAGNGEILYRSGSQSRRFILKWDGLAKPSLTVGEPDGTLQLTAEPGADGRIQTVVFRSANRQAGEIRLR